MEDSQLRYKNNITFTTIKQLLQTATHLVTNQQDDIWENQVVVLPRHTLQQLLATTHNNRTYATACFIDCVRVLCPTRQK